MTIINCQRCGRELVEDYLCQCPYCKQEITSCNPELKNRMLEGRKHRLKKYVNTNIDYICKEKSITPNKLYQELSITDKDIESFPRIKKEDPVIQRLAEYANLSDECFLYKDLRLPESCRDICQYAGIEIFGNKLLVELEKDGAKRWRRLSREDTYNDGKYRQIGFIYDGDGFEIKLLGLCNYDTSEYTDFCHRLPKYAYEKTRITVYGLNDYKNKTLYSEKKLFLYLLDNLLEKKNIEYRDWDTYPEFVREVSSSKGISYSIDMSKVLNERVEEYMTIFSSAIKSLNELENTDNTEEVRNKLNVIREEIDSSVEAMKRREEQRKEEKERRQKEQRHLNIEKAQEIIKQLVNKEDDVNSSFGQKCKLYKVDKVSKKEELIYKNTCMECIKKAYKEIEDLTKEEQYVLVHFHPIYCSTIIIDSDTIVDSLKRIDENSKKDSKPEFTPFKESIIPKQYVKYNICDIGINSVDALWESVQIIKQRYFGSENNENIELSEDYLSEASYEIARYLEDVRWVGQEPKIPDEFRSKNYCLSYANMDPEQFAYYLFWRTEILHGNMIPPHNKGFLGTLFSELIMQIGVPSESAAILMMDKIKSGYKDIDYLCIRWIDEYKYLNGFSEDKVFLDAYYSHVSWFKPINKNDYTEYVDCMVRKSPWKIKNSAFVKKTDCSEYIKDVLLLMIPKFQLLFKDNDLVFSEFLEGKYKISSYIYQYYRNSLWSGYTLRRVLGVEGVDISYYEPIYPSNRIRITDSDGTLKNRSTGYRSYNDPFLCEYVVRTTETLFREAVGYKYIQYPEKLIGAMKVKFANGYEYLLSEDDDDRERELKYISLYDEILSIIQECFTSYSIQHAKIIDQMRARLVTG